MSTTFLILLAVLAFSALVGLVLQHWFLSRLRKQHPLVWETLGRPTLSLNHGMQSYLTVWRFLWRREHQTLEDLRTIMLGDFLRSYMTGYLLLLISAIVALMLNQRAD
ncbi:MAG TPA: hypothetical protein DDZ88_19790 [Verrucomicrobiales bacterium]|nr:hypothetical protein [Verrucomicrobiales bacterium]